MANTDSTKGYQTVPLSAHSEGQDSTATSTIKALGAIRAVAGVALFLAPQFVGKLFHVPISAQAALLGRAVGTRDFIVGELTLTADTKGKDKKEVRRALWANIAVDALDITATTIAFSSGQMSRMGAGLFGGAAATFILLGAIGLRSLPKDIV